MTPSTEQISLQAGGAGLSRAIRLLLVIGLALAGLGSALPTVAASAPADGPTLTWNTFLGGSNYDSANAIALDESHNTYLAGYSNGTWGDPVAALPGGEGVDIFVARLDPDGNLLWNTFLGAAGEYDNAYGIAVDGDGNIYVAGVSYASWGDPLADKDGAGSDAFVAKLDDDGNLLWNTFLGGSGWDEAEAITADGDGNVFIAGYSDASWGSPVNDYAGDADGFVAQLDSNGSLQWNTFLGSSDWDEAMSIKLAGNGSLVVAGNSKASWGSPVDAFSGSYDGFAANLDSDGALQWNTFLGSAQMDFAYGVAAGENGAIAVTGASETTWGDPIDDFAGGVDPFVVKLDSSGARIWNTFLCSADCVDSEGWSVAMDGSGNVTVVGYSDANWGNPIQSYSGDGNGDGFVAQLDGDGGLLWNTFLGTSEEDAANAVVVDDSGGIYLAGYSEATWGSPVRAYTDKGDSFVTLISVPQAKYIFLPCVIR